MTDDSRPRRAKARRGGPTETGRDKAGVELDTIDKRLVDVLKANARTTNRTIATLIDLSPSASSVRIKKLEERRIILGYTALIAGGVDGMERSCLIEVRLESRNPLLQRKFEILIRADANVLEAAKVAGEYDYLLRMTSASAEGWRRLADAAHAVGVAVRDARITSIVEGVKGALGA